MNKETVSDELMNSSPTFKTINREKFYRVNVIMTQLRTYDSKPVVGQYNPQHNSVKYNSPKFKISPTITKCLFNSQSISDSDFLLTPGEKPKSLLDFSKQKDRPNPESMCTCNPNEKRFKYIKEPDNFSKKKKVLVDKFENFEGRKYVPKEEVAPITGAKNIIDFEPKSYINQEKQN